MRYAGVDIASEAHVFAVVDECGSVLVKPTSFGEEADGYATLLSTLGSPEDCLVAMEATGHYWKNLFVALAIRGFAVALINPLRTRRFAEEDLQRTKTDSINAVGIAQFALQKKPVATQLPDSATEELREMIELRDRLTRDAGNRVRQLHRLVNLGFPEFTRHIKDLGSQRATAILSHYPTAQAYERLSVSKLSRLCYDGRRFVGEELAQDLIQAARRSVGAHHAEIYCTQIVYLCEDLDVFRRRLKQLDQDIETKLDQHQVGSLLTSIEGVGSTTAARLACVIGDPIRFSTGAALACYTGAIPGLQQSGKHQPSRAALTPIGNVRLRTALYMPTLAAIRFNPWLRAYYEHLIAKGKLPKVAILACMRKLLTAAFSVAKNRRPFVPHLRSCEAP
jgi:transposase